MRIEQGWQFLAIGSELKMMLDAAAGVLKGIGATQQGEMARY